MFVLLLLAQSIAPAWDTTKLFDNLSSQSKQLAPLLKQIHPKDWDAPGGADYYVKLRETAIAQNDQVAVEAAGNAKTPESLTVSLKLLLRVHSAETAIGPLLEAVRKYQNPALAELISGVVAEGSPARAAFEQRVLDLAAEREEQLATTDHEAQRCREMLSKAPPARPVKSK